MSTNSQKMQVLASASVALESLIPENSKELYRKEYRIFKEWMKVNATSSVSEMVILAYLKEKGDFYKPSTLWCLYSKLKSTLQIYENIDIGKYNLVKAFMKRKNVGYEPKKAKVLSRDDIIKFVTEAPDSDFLAIKVILAFGVAGACRSDELYKMRITDIEDTKNFLIITIPQTKTNKKRIFTVLQEPFVNGVQLYRKYKALRPKVSHPWLFLSLRKGKCTRQRIGINTFYGVPRRIAKYLNLEKPSEYTGHSLRRSSATLLADSGADILTLKRHGGWRSDNVAAGYVEDSIEQKVKTAKRILVGEGGGPSTSAMAEVGDQENELACEWESFGGIQAQSVVVEETTKAADVIRLGRVGGCTFNCNNCTLNVYLPKGTE